MRRSHDVPLILALLVVLAFATVGAGRGPTDSPTTSGSVPLTAVDCSAPPPSFPGQLTFAGLAYGPYHLGQTPHHALGSHAGVSPSVQEVEADMPTLAALTRYIRIYSSQGPANAIVESAADEGVCVNVGVWLSRDAQANASEIAALEALAEVPVVRSVTVGNEVLLRGDMSVDELRRAIAQVRAVVDSSVEITVADDYNQWLAHPELAEDVDFITVHIYPFWQHQSIDSAINVLQDAYTRVRGVFPGKRIVIGETGWPSAGSPLDAAVPGPESESRYVAAFVEWSDRHGVPYFYFETFDESWKSDESDVGTHWGLYQQDGVLKPELSSLLPAADPKTITERSFRDVYVGGLEAGFGLGIDTSGQLRDWIQAGSDGLTLAYPSGQMWGTMFITAGEPAVPGVRSSIDLSDYASIVAEIRAPDGEECVRVGIKDVTQPDDGSESTARICATSEWTPFALPLEYFEGVDTSQLYVVFELVFDGAAGSTIEVRNIRYSPEVAEFPPEQPPFVVYADRGSSENHYIPSGFMGDLDALQISEDWSTNCRSGSSCIRVRYSGVRTQGQGWAGIYWQDPANNWGSDAGSTGYDLSEMQTLSFWARGATGGEVVKFEMGGIGGTNGDSLASAVSLTLTLGSDWQYYTIDLSGRDLHHVIGGFAFALSRADQASGATFYLDDIRYT